MDPKQIDLNETVFRLCAQYPELAEAMAAIGFNDIVKPGMLNTAGRFMTNPKGAALQKLDLNQVIQKLSEYGFSVKKQEKNHEPGNQ